jgi:hypothetical protein
VRSFGFRVKSGFAIAVVLDGSPDQPQAVARKVVELSDPDAIETRQPYHHGFYTTEDDAREIARRLKIVQRCAKRSVDGLISEMCRAPASAARGVRAALVVGSVIDPANISNPHIRAHAHEGRLFRTVLADALRTHGIESEIIVDKQLAQQAARHFGHPPSTIARMLTTFAKALGGPWRADEKAAATAAWMALNR